MSRILRFIRSLFLRAYESPLLHTPLKKYEDILYIKHVKGREWIFTNKSGAVLAIRKPKKGKNNG